MPQPRPHPLRLAPVLVPKPWGGRRLADFGKLLPHHGAFGESWDVADLPAEAVGSGVPSRSLVCEGPLEGHSPADVIALWGRDLLGSAPATPEGDFPLLYKLLDAHQHLSVQVHPDERYVADHPHARLKTESWYIVHADPDAVIYKGLRPDVTIADVAEVAGGSGMVELLQAVPAETGAFHHLPAGLVHALGAGVLVAEPQTPSDTTFRLYDWTEEYGRAARTLHVEEALGAIRLRPEGMVTLRPAPPLTIRTLVVTPHYWMREHATTTDAGRLVGGGELRILSVLGGHVVVSHEGSQMELGAGDLVLIPAAISATVDIESFNATILEIGLTGTPPADRRR